MNDANARERARKKDGDDCFSVKLPIAAQPDAACDQQKCDDNSCDLLGRHVPFVLASAAALPSKFSSAYILI